MSLSVFFEKACPRFFFSCKTDRNELTSTPGSILTPSKSSSAEVRIGDVINPNDHNIYRQLSGGTVAAQLLHGSANPIGGQSALWYGCSAPWEHTEGQCQCGSLSLYLG